MSQEVKMIQPQLLPAGQWHRRMNPPFYAYMQSTISGQAVSSGPTIHVAIGLFAMISDPHDPRPDCRRAVVDADGWIVFGYSTDKAFMAEHGHPAWFGCELGFALVESMGIIDPLELAMRESIAREAVDTEEWWKQ